MKKYKDERGAIETLLEGVAVDSVLRITSKAGTRRANHYHKASGHWCTLTRGQMLYYERPVGSADKPSMRLVTTGETVWTGPMLEHLMVFQEDTEFWCFSTGSRVQDNYETDLVRLDFDLDAA